MVASHELEVALYRSSLRRRLPVPEVRRHVREAAKATQAEVAHAVGVTQTAVCHWETGRREPSGETLEMYFAVLQRLARAAGLNVIEDEVALDGVQT